MADASSICVIFVWHVLKSLANIIEDTDSPFARLARRRALSAAPSRTRRRQTCFSESRRPAGRAQVKGWLGTQASVFAFYRIDTFLHCSNISIMSFVVPHLCANFWWCGCLFHFLLKLQQHRLSFVEMWMTFCRNYGKSLINAGSQFILQRRP